MQASAQKTRIKQITQPHYSSHNRRTEPDTPPTVPAVHRTGRSAKLSGGLCVSIDRPHREQPLRLANLRVGQAFPKVRERTTGDAAQPACCVFGLAFFNDATRNSTPASELERSSCSIPASPYLPLPMRIHWSSLQRMPTIHRGQSQVDMFGDAFFASDQQSKSDPPSRALARVQTRTAPGVLAIAPANGGRLKRGPFVRGPSVIGARGSMLPRPC